MKHWLMGKDDDDSFTIFRQVEGVLPASWDKIATGLTYDQANTIVAAYHREFYEGLARLAIDDWQRSHTREQTRQVLEEMTEVSREQYLDGWKGSVIADWLQVLKSALG
jgi:hypothetical protein